MDAYVAIEVANCMMGDMSLEQVFSFFGVPADAVADQAKRVELCQSN